MMMGGDERDYERYDPVRKSLGYDNVHQYLMHLSEPKLPDFMIDEPMVRWILHLDPLQGNLPSWWRMVVDPWTMAAKRQIGFYRAAILHLAWQFQTASEGYMKCREVLRKDNLQQSAAKLVAAYDRSRTPGHRRREISSEEAYSAIVRAALAAEAQHAQDLRDAERWWSLWKQEIELFGPALRASVEEVSLETVTSALLSVPALTWSSVFGTSLERELIRGGWRLRESYGPSRFK